MMSEKARQALRAAVALNPDGARLLRAILRTAPEAVKHKPQDRFGPLAMMVAESRPVSSPPPSLRDFVKPMLPGELWAGAELFQREWIAGSFNKDDLANHIEACLHELGEPIPDVSGSWNVL